MNVISEKTPPGKEHFIKKLKRSFKKRYGKKKGLSYLYATAWKQYNNESVEVDEAKEVKMPFSAFAKEHKRLLKVLSKKDPEELEAERKDQAKEFEDVKRNLKEAKKYDIKVYDSSGDKVIAKFDTMEALNKWNENHNVNAIQVTINNLVMYGWDEIENFDELFKEKWESSMQPQYRRALEYLHTIYTNKEDMLKAARSYAGKNMCSMGEAIIALAKQQGLTEARQPQRGLKAHPILPPHLKKEIDGYISGDVVSKDFFDDWVHEFLSSVGFPEAEDYKPEIYKYIKSKGCLVESKWKPGPKIDINIGDEFDTEAEEGCIVTSLPDADGEFLALDSEGVECRFNTSMVTKIHEWEDHLVRKNGRLISVNIPVERDPHYNHLKYGEMDESFNTVTESLANYYDSNKAGYWYGFVDKGPIFEYRARNKNKVIALPSRTLTGRLLETKNVDGRWYVRLENQIPSWAQRQYNLIEQHGDASLVKESSGAPTRYVPTGLSGPVNEEILNSVIGQLSDGMWENTPAMAKYWRNCEIENGPDGQLLIAVKDGWDSGFRNRDDTWIRNFFAGKIKILVYDEMGFGGKNSWSRQDTTSLDYLSNGNREVTVSSAYRAYETLKGRKIGNKYDTVTDSRGVVSAVPQAY